MLQWGNYSPICYCWALAQGNLIKKLPKWLELSINREQNSLSIYNIQAFYPSTSNPALDLVAIDPFLQGVIVKSLVLKPAAVNALTNKSSAG